MKEFEDFLVELGTEELPPKALAKLSRAFQQSVEQGLKKAELSFEEIRPYASPRRLALVVTKLQTRQADRVVERRGPAVTAAFDDDGNATKALQGFAAILWCGCRSARHHENRQRCLAGVQTGTAGRGSG